MPDHDLTNLDNYEQDYELPWYDRVEKIYELPDINDMAAVILRSNLKVKDERRANAMIRLAYRHIKFGLKGKQELLRMKCAATAAEGGAARLDALFAAVNLIAPDMYRASRGLPKHKDGKNEDIRKASDFNTIESSERRPKDY